MESVRVAIFFSLEAGSIDDVHLKAPLVSSALCKSAAIFMKRFGEYLVKLFETNDTSYPTQGCESKSLFPIDIFVLPRTLFRETS